MNILKVRNIKKSFILGLYCALLYSYVGRERFVVLLTLKVTKENQNLSIVVIIYATALTVSDFTTYKSNISMGRCIEWCSRYQHWKRVVLGHGKKLPKVSKTGPNTRIQSPIKFVLLISEQI